MTKNQFLKPISRDLIIDRLKFENPWWVTNSIDEDYKVMQRRLYFNLFFSLVSNTDVKRAVVLMGPRRVGKTVMMHHCIGELLGTNINPHKICYIGIDNPIYLNMSLDELFELTREAAGNADAKGWFVFFDEIQYMRNWESHLKVLVDSYPHTRFIATGSAAAALKLKSQESGAGRFTEFMLPPLTFHEYIHLKKYDHLIQPTKIDWNGNKVNFYKTINIKEINNHFIDYINYGGYPEVIFSDLIRSNPGRYIKSDIIDKVLLRDLPGLYGIQDVQELNSFFTTLAYYSGNEVSLESLSQTSGVDKTLLKKYLEYLEAAFLIKVVHRIDDNAKKFQRVVRYKVYLTNPSLRSALFSPIEATDEALGAMVETAIFSQWMHREWFTPWYARWSQGKLQGEVDMVCLDAKKLKPQWALEIKWSNRYWQNPSDLKSLVHFCHSNQLKSALVTSIDKEEIINYSDIELHFVPASMYAYTVGVKTIEQLENRNHSIF
jgi:predicted AAA+ superfamily ATPase